MFCKKQKAPDKCNAKANEYNAIHPVNDMNIMRCEPVAYFAREHHFSEIAGEYNTETG